MAHDIWNRIVARDFQRCLGVKHHRPSIGVRAARSLLDAGFGIGVARRRSVNCVVSVAGHAASARRIAYAASKGA